MKKIITLLFLATALLGYTQTHELADEYWDKAKKQKDLEINPLLPNSKANCKLSESYHKLALGKSIIYKKICISVWPTI